MKRWKNRLLLALGAIAIVALIIWFSRPVPAEVDVVRVVRGPLRETIDDDGKTRIKDRYVVSAPLAGRLQRISLRAGDPARAGSTLLAVIEPKDPDLLDAAARGQAEARVKAAEAARKQADALVERARAEHELAEAEVLRIKPLFDTGNASRQEMDTAAARERAAAEALRSAQFGTLVAAFELEQAKAALLRTRPRESGGAADDARFEIRSPITGKVLRVLQESATVVSPGTPLLELGDTTELEIVIDVLSADAVRVPPGARVWLEHWGGNEALPARVRLVEPSAFLKVSALGVEEQRVNVIADFDSPPEAYSRLGDGYRVEARIVVWESPSVLKVPAGALFRHGDGWAVFMYRDGRAELRPVRIGHSDGNESEVLEGLTEGDEVIIHPSDKVRDGARVQPR